MVIDVKFKIGDTVYLHTDNDQEKRIVTGFKIRATGIIYLLACGADESPHYDFEISSDKILY